MEIPSNITFPVFGQIVSLVLLTISAGVLGVAVPIAKAADDEYSKAASGKDVLALREQRQLDAEIAQHRGRLVAMQILFGVLAALAGAVVFAQGKNASLLTDRELTFLAVSASVVATVAMSLAFRYLMASRSDKARVEHEIAEVKAVQEIQRRLVTSINALASRPDEPMVIKEF